MNGRKAVKARYVSDIPDSFLRKGKIYTCRYIELKDYLAYTDDKGENYALPADRFEIIKENDQETA